MKSASSLIAAFLLLLSAPSLQAADSTCAFTRKPRLSRDGDETTVRFAVQEFCDATVAVEDSRGKILRHLASGMLGSNAPRPFRKNSLEQSVVWDGKDDLGRYIDDTSSLRVRVSLGLKPRFEKTLYWSPVKRTRGPSYISNPPILVAAPEGVYVYDGGNGDHIRLFSHKGDYVRTIYPFPADKIKDVRGLEWKTFPQDGRRLPVKGNSPVLNTFLLPEPAKFKKLAMAVRGDRLVLSGRRLNRLATDGTSGGLPLIGPRSSVTATLPGFMYFRGGTFDLPPKSIALSPDGKWVYMTGYGQNNYGNGQWLRGVTRTGINAPPALLRKNDLEPEPEVFAGIMECPGGVRRLIQQKKLDPKSEALRLQLPASVACDAKGRVYVADYLGDCIQVFATDRAFLRTIPVQRPAQVHVHPKTGDIYVFSWRVANHLTRARKDRIAWSLVQLGPFSDPENKSAFVLPKDLRIAHSYGSATLDLWTDPPTIWAAGGADNRASGGPKHTGESWTHTCIRLYALEGRKLLLKRHLGREGLKGMPFMRPVRHGYQKIYFDPKNERLYVGELYAPHPFHVTGMLQVPWIDPDTGAISVTKLPFDAEDMAFDMEGHAYLRTANAIARYNAKTWREVPFDYGEETRVTAQGIAAAEAVSAVRCAGQLGIASSQMGGINVSPRGNVVLTVCNPNRSSERGAKGNVHSAGVKAYVPELYPGRARPWEIHVWDKHGQLLYEDAVRGIGCYMNGVAMDRDHFVYVMLAATGLLNGKRYPNPLSCTWLKARPGTKLLSRGGRVPLPLPREQHPNRPPDFGKTWTEGAEWYRAGVGIDGKRGGCHCMSHSRPALDYFARSFLPEVDRYSVLVLDANGNEIIRFGRYGNVDDGTPLVEPGGPPKPRSIGGDEIAIMHNQMLAVHSDRRLFIGDLGNACIRSVRLDYETSERVPMKNP